MIEYRERVPRDAAPDADRETERRVRAALSIVASDTDDPTEFAAEVIIDRRDIADRIGGHWVHGTLDREPMADYLRTRPPPEKYRIPGAISHREKRWKGGQDWEGGDK